MSQKSKRVKKVAKKIDELREQSALELSEKLAVIKAELAKERSLAVSGTKSEKPSKIRGLKRAVARILTIINEKKKSENKKTGERK